jgi:hypothetical protein
VNAPGFGMCLIRVLTGCVGLLRATTQRPLSSLTCYIFRAGILLLPSQKPSSIPAKHRTEVHQVQGGHGEERSVPPRMCRCCRLCNISCCTRTLKALCVVAHTTPVAQLNTQVSQYPSKGLVTWCSQIEVKSRLNQVGRCYSKPTLACTTEATLCDMAPFPNAPQCRQEEK